MVNKRLETKKFRQAKIRGYQVSLFLPCDMISLRLIEHHTPVCPGIESGHSENRIAASFELESVRFVVIVQPVHGAAFTC